MNDDLISRAAAIDSVEIFLKQTDAPKVYPGLIPALERVINNVPSAQPEQRWIPCSERLPDSKEYVLVTDYGETNMGRRFCGRWWLDCCGDKLKDVTAWMPLPEPYKEDGE